ncbi:glycosyltransferase family 4 protein [Patescibacteria group bacterium]|nr:glycosyltransferase family 4 protein [Patescibacteria group bacterium]
MTEKLESLGVKVFVIARKMKGTPECVLSSRVSVHRAWALRPHVHILEEMSLSNLMISLSFCFSTALILFRKKKEYDLVHFHGASLPLITNILPLKLYGKKVVAKVASANQGTEAGSLRHKYSLFGQMLIRTLKKVDCFVATSKEIKKGLLNDGYIQDRIIGIPNFVDQGVFHPSDKELRDQAHKDFGFSGETIVTFTGRLVKGKGIGVLLAAWGKVVVDFKNVCLLILGEGPFESRLKEQCQGLGIEKNVKFLGLVNNVRKYLAMSDIFVFPSFQEGFPNSVLEAMACGLPVIATRIGGIVDVIKDEENGLLVEPGNANQLADALKRLICDAEYASALGRNALKTIRKNYDINVIANEYIDLYTGLMKY